MADTTNRDELLTVIREGIPNPVEVEDGVRAMLLDLFDRAMREQWGDWESREAVRAAMAEAKARFGWAGVIMSGPLERRVYRLFFHSPAADDVERERRRAHREERLGVAAGDDSET